MLIERIWPDNRLRNFHYLVACGETGEALAIDPLDGNLVQDAARAYKRALELGCGVGLVTIGAMRAGILVASSW